MFINALSWKKFNGGKKKAVVEGGATNKPKSNLAFRPPLDNIHPTVDNNKNIQNALCHGSKTTSLADGRRGLDIARSATVQGARAQEGARSQTSKSHSQVSQGSDSRPIYWICDAKISCQR